jgi:hypothetical protein
MPLVIKLSASGKCPKIKVSKPILAFGDCAVNDHKDLEVMLKNNREMDIDFSFP